MLGPAVRLHNAALLAACLALGVQGEHVQAGENAGKRQHPYLYFSAEELASLRARVKQAPFAARWKRFLKSADHHLKAGVTKGSVASTLGRSRPALGVCGITAFAYAVTGERRYGERAKKEAFALLDAGPWHKRLHYNKGAHLSTGEASVACALVYDWCHDLFSPEERTRFREKLLERSIRVYLQSVEKHRDWWVKNPVTNWCGVIHGGCGLAALAIHDESPEARRAAGLAREHLQKFLRTATLEDGGGHEGVMYWRYGVKFGHYFTYAAGRFFGDDKGLYEDAAAKLSGYWDVYMQGPDGVYANFNDMNEKTFSGLYGQDRRRWEGGPCSVLCALMESRTKKGDPLLLWGADNGGASFYWRGVSPFWFIWRRTAPPAGPRPKLQDAVLFRGAGHVRLQSPSLWLAYNGGWISNKSHHNLDLGSFVLVAGGERLVHDPGYGRKETGEHSTVLVDGKGQQQSSRGEFLRFGSGKGFHYFASDLSRCYGKQLKRFVRHVVMADDSYLVLLDDLEGPRASEFEWRLQTRCRITLAPPEKRATLQGDKVALHVLAVCPEDAEVSKGKAGVEFVRVRPAAKRAHETMVTVLYPVAASGGVPKVEFAVRGPRGSLTVTRPGGRRDMVAFVRDAAGWRLEDVNGKSASGIGPPKKRTLTPFR